MRLSQSFIVTVFCCTALVCLAAASAPASGSISGNGEVAATTARSQLLVQLRSAAAAGDLGLAGAVQKQLMRRSHKEHSQRRKLMQPATIDRGGDCEALASSMQGCAEWQCRTTNTLVKNPDGSVTCKYTPTAAPPPQVTFDEFEDAYGLAYDYSELWNTDGNYVLSAASYAGTTTINTNVNTKSGEWGAKSTVADANRRAIVTDPLLGALATDETNLNLFTGSTKIVQDAKKPLTVDSSLSTGFDTKATYGAYLPGTTATPREVEEGDGKGSEDNVVVPIRNWFGRRRD